MTLNTIWLFPVDNKFAETVIGPWNRANLFPRSPPSTRLCSKCEALDFCQDGFRIEETMSELVSSMETCEFCKMRWNAIKNLDPQKLQGLLKFQREESMLKLNEGNPPILSLCRTPGKSPRSYPWAMKVVCLSNIRWARLSRKERALHSDWTPTAAR